MPRSIPRARIALGLLTVLILSGLLGRVPAVAAAAHSNRAAASLLTRLQLELGRLEAPVTMGTSLWLAMQAKVKGTQARIRHDQHKLRSGPGKAAAADLRADLRREQRSIAPLMPWWLWVKGLLHRSWHQVKLTLLQVRRVVVATAGARPGANGVAAWRRVFHRQAPTQTSRLDACPVDGPSFSVDTFGAPRPGGRFHEGVDLQTARGVPVVAALPGFARHVPNTLGGNAVIVDSDGGTYVYYAHLSAYGASGSVSAGDVIGYAGATGDARGLIPHLHFELHPGGGAAVDAFADLQAVC